MELLLTGATGFVGRNLLLLLITDTRWNRIILPVRDPEKLKAQLKSELGVEIETVERLHILKVSGDAWELPSTIHPDLVIHAAGRLFGRERKEYFQTNVQGSLNLAAQLPESTRMIVLSSLAAGGPTPNGLDARAMQMVDAPVSYYGESKLAMEQALKEELGSRLLILRPPMVLGPRDAATIPLFQMAKCLVRVKPGFQPKYYSWIAVDDLCEALLVAASSPWTDAQSPLYLSSAKSITDIQLLATAAEVIASRGMTLRVPQAAIQFLSMILDAVPAWREAVPSLGRDRVREILPDYWICDGGDFEKIFNWQPLNDLTETLRSTAEFLKKSGAI